MSKLSSDIINTSIYWFRKDLRLHDNPALWHAVRDSRHVILIYIYQENLSDAGQWKMGSAQKWWLHHSLQSLFDSIKSNGNSSCTLLLKQGSPIKIFESLFSRISKSQINAIYYNNVYEPWARNQEDLLDKLCSKHKIRSLSFNGSLLLPPDQVMNRSNSYFKVFTPYWRACCEALVAQQSGHHPRLLYDRPALKPPPPQLVESLTDALGGVDAISDWSLLPTHPDWAGGLRATWKVSESEGQAQLKAFVSGKGMVNYDEGRDKPFLEGGTSRLSPYLALGQIGPWQIWHAAKPAQSVPHKGRDRFLSELGWREFSYYLLWHVPTLPDTNYRPEFDRFEWVPTSGTALKAQLEAWKRGRTGYPVVDAGMRQLWYEGYMHNRVRMVTASFLTKDLLIDWRIGSAWFWDTLVDADLANNANGWQWVAGTGADAAPYFRVFNPVLQGEKFDPDGAYVKRWIPELAHLPPKYVHQPWTCPAPILAKANLRLGTDYPRPIVDHDKCRKRALEYFGRLKMHGKAPTKPDGSSHGDKTEEPDHKLDASEGTNDPKRGASKRRAVKGAKK